MADSCHNRQVNPLYLVAAVGLKLRRLKVGILTQLIFRYVMLLQILFKL